MHHKKAKKVYLSTGIRFNIDLHMRLYHYTTIETLALILKNQTIRFNRLDQVNDLEENVYSEGVKVGKYSFVSCWTTNKDESIPLWKIYTGNGIGVRISLDHDMFKRYDSITGVFREGETLPLSKDSIFITPFEDFFSKPYMVLPIHESEINSILKKIIYVDNVENANKKVVSHFAHPNNIEEIKLNIPEIGKYKHSRWSFEDETRFVIVIFPNNNYRTAVDFSKNYNSILFSSMKNGIEPPITYYDMKLKNNVFDDLEVTMSPSMPLADKIIVESLLNQYAPQAVLRTSSLEKKVR